MKKKAEHSSVENSLLQRPNASHESGSLAKESHGKSIIIA